MKTGNVILAIFLWLCIPVSFAIGLLFGVFGGGPMCVIGSPLLFFILGLIALLTGMEKKHQPPSLQPAVIQQPIQPHYSSQQVAIQQPTNDTRNKNYYNVIEMKETGEREFMYDRQNLIYGVSFIGFGIIIFILTIWIEPLVNNVAGYQWFILAIRIIGVISIVVGIIRIIASLLPRK
jgi:hypothetical protein